MLPKANNVSFQNVKTNMDEESVIPTTVKNENWAKNTQGQIGEKEIKSKESK